MSKASEWVKMAPDMIFIESDVDEGMYPVKAMVTREGDLLFSGFEEDEEADCLSPAQALRLAQWILDTFRDEA